MSGRLIVGIDPGLNGAITFMRSDVSIEIYDTPTFEIQSGKVKHREYDIVRMAHLLNSFSTCSCHVALEKIHSMPGQGVASMFKMGVGYGIWQGLIAMKGWPITLVAPQRWKKTMMDGMGKEKEASRFRALQLFPRLLDQLNRKKDHNRADSLLIAEYLRREVEGNQL